MCIFSRQSSDYYSSSSQDPYAAVVRGPPPEADPRAALSILGSVPYRSGTDAAALLASDLRRNDTLAASYGVTLPPSGRDYSSATAASAASIRDVLRDEDLLRRDVLLREKEHERERERERDRIRDRERDRERERERERERNREREREREKERERERERERQRAREREKEMERRMLRDRSKDRRGSSLLRDDKGGARRVSPRRDSAIRLIN